MRIPDEHGMFMSIFPYPSDEPVEILANLCHFGIFNSSSSLFALGKKCNLHTDVFSG